MDKSFIRELFKANNITVGTNRQHLFDAFVNEEKNRLAVRQILENKKLLMDTWQFKNRLADIQQQPVSIPNATAGKPYEVTLDFGLLKWNDFTYFHIEGLEETGLQYDPETKVIRGTPVKSGDFKLTLKYRINGEDETTAPNEKKVPLVINPNPRSLWKNIDSDKNDPYWKEDNVAEYAPLGDRHLLVASKRGRSHANTGGFREDDFAFKHFGDTGWSVMAVSDGAGSARLSRAGSRIACTGIVEYFEQHFTPVLRSAFDALIAAHATAGSDKTQKELTRFVYDNLGKAAFTVHKKLEEFAVACAAPVKDLHSTLIFVLLKKYESGYVIMSFGVGDCPIALINKDFTDIQLLNRLDVGEFSGGTRFITMQEIFKSDTFATRFGFRLVPDFSYLMLMTDGIYDPKFEVEANLEKLTAWKALLEDLGGKNDDNVKVDLASHTPETASQLSAWMDFWSPGNHDDRTLMIIS
ncbi:PP2C family serine/threonine-protein phosphatase [Chitinophaga sp. ARDCPP14]|uniref:PP2C family serine/threonine-protein phosphatase n=1 Tax=Chitinophaga sp. ARDCPP14 TaxID=3391139 RepID=UPI003F5281C1